MNAKPIPHTLHPDVFAEMDGTVKRAGKSFVFIECNSVKPFRCTFETREQPRSHEAMNPDSFDALIASSPDRAIQGRLTLLRPELDNGSFSFWRDDKLEYVRLVLPGWERRWALWPNKRPQGKDTGGIAGSIAWSS